MVFICDLVFFKYIGKDVPIPLVDKEVDSLECVKAFEVVAINTL